MFYEMQHDDIYIDVKYETGTDWEGIVCPVNEGHQRAGNRIGPLRINIIDKRISDFYTTFLSEWIISDIVTSIFNKNKFTGYVVKPVIISNLQLPYRLWEFIICGKGGDADPASGIYLKYECKYCNHRRYSAFENGIIVDENNWDGSDFFTVNGYSRYILVTERVKVAIEENKLTGVKFVPSYALRWPEGVIKP